MTRTQQKREELLAKADDSDDRARAASDPFYRATWKSIAKGYRLLAERVG